MYHLVHFVNTNALSKMRICHLKSFFLVLLSKNLVLFGENKRAANELKSTNRHRDTNYKTLNLIDLIKCPTRLFIGSLNQYLCMYVKISYLLQGKMSHLLRVIKYDFSQWPKTVYHTKVYEIKLVPLTYACFLLLLLLNNFQIPTTHF